MFSTVVSGGAVCSDGFTNTSHEETCKQLWYVKVHNKYIVTYNYGYICIYICITDTYVYIWAFHPI